MWSDSCKKTKNCNVATCLWLSLISLCFTAWCLRSEGVSSVLLGVSNADQLLENLGALRVEFLSFFPPTSIIVPDILSRSCFSRHICYFVCNTTLNWLPSFPPPCRFYPKWPLKPLLRLMPCWEISHTRRKSCALEDANLSDRWCFEKRRRQWHWETSLFALLYTQQLACPQQHYASSMCAYPFCAVHCIMYEKKKISQLWKKKEKNRSYIAHCRLFTD